MSITKSCILDVQKVEYLIRKPIELLQSSLKKECFEYKKKHFHVIEMLHIFGK